MAESDAEADALFEDVDWTGGRVEALQAGLTAAGDEDEDQLERERRARASTISGAPATLQ